MSYYAFWLTSAPPGASAPEIVPVGLQRIGLDGCSLRPFVRLPGPCIHNYIVGLSHVSHPPTHRLRLSLGCNSVRLLLQLPFLGSARAAVMAMEGTEQPFKDFLVPAGEDIGGQGGEYGRGFVPAELAQW